METVLTNILMPVAFGRYEIYYYVCGRELLVSPFEFVCVLMLLLCSKHIQCSVVNIVWCSVCWFHNCEVVTENILFESHQATAQLTGSYISILLALLPLLYVITNKFIANSLWLKSLRFEMYMHELSRTYLTWLEATEPHTQQQQQYKRRTSLWDNYSTILMHATWYMMLILFCTLTLNVTWKQTHARSFLINDPMPRRWEKERDRMKMEEEKISKWAHLCQTEQHWIHTYMRNLNNVQRQIFGHHFSKFLYLKSHSGRIA